MKKIFVTVTGGVAEVCEDTVPAGYTVEIIDFDNIEDMTRLPGETFTEWVLRWLEAYEARTK